MDSKLCRQRREESTFLLAGTAYAQVGTVGLGHEKARLYSDHRAWGGGRGVTTPWS